ncbi:hypothetical protein V7S43_011660 [Phytophthora oleae]|uniref:Uncharacterized protein n=1 Tax=Phytophthora oleae TaxID=2107226 RepID=A0ABD3FC20_9STRA
MKEVPDTGRNLTVTFEFEWCRTAYSPLVLESEENTATEAQMDFPPRGHRRHRSDFGFRSPHFPDLRDFSRLTDNLFHGRHAEPQRSPGSHPQWRYVPPPYGYGPPPPPPPYSMDYSHPTRYSAPAEQNLGYTPLVAEPPASVKSTASAPSAPLSEERWSKSNPAPSAPATDWGYSSGQVGSMASRHR